MLRTALLRVHGWLGLSAGLVLALLGLTGAAMSFDEEILRALNPAIFQLPVERASALAPAALLARAQQERPGQRVASLELARDRAVRVVYAGAGGRRGESLWLDPRSGALLARDDELA